MAIETTGIDHVEEIGQTLVKEPIVAIARALKGNKEMAEMAIEAYIEVIENHPMLKPHGYKVTFQITGDVLLLRMALPVELVLNERL